MRRKGIGAMEEKKKGVVGKRESKKKKGIVKAIDLMNTCNCLCLFICVMQPPRCPG